MVKSTQYQSLSFDHQYIFYALVHMFTKNRQRHSKSHHT